MHPIERLRYVARSAGADQGMLVRETAGALAVFTDDPAGMVTACRRIISRQPGSGPLWWLCSRVLTATEPMREAWQASDDIDDDATAATLARALPDDAIVTVLGWPDQASAALAHRGDVQVLVVDALGEGSGLVRRLERADTMAFDVPVAGTGAAVAASQVLVLEASVAGPDGALVVAGSLAAAAVARHEGVPVWLVAGVGRLVPGRIWTSIRQRLDADGCEPWDADDEVVPYDLVDQVVGPGGLAPPADAIRRTDCPIAPELLKEL